MDENEITGHMEAITVPLPGNFPGSGNHRYDHLPPAGKL
jgi:hypothetical protein